MEPILTILSEYLSKQEISIQLKLKRAIVVIYKHQTASINYAKGRFTIITDLLYATSIELADPQCFEKVAETVKRPSQFSEMATINWSNKFL